MNIPNNLPLTDEQGRPRKNGEERKAINDVLDYLRWHSMSESERGDREAERGMRDAGFSEQLITATHVPTDRMTLQSSVRPEWSNAARPLDDEIPEGTVDEERFGTDSPYVNVKRRHGWEMVRREAAGIASMVAEDEASGTSGEPL